MNKIYKQCQSCGMPLDKDPGKGGTQKDGSHSTKWCSLCYKDGEFTGKDCTLDEMKNIVEKALEKEKMNWFIKKMALWQIPHLERWKQTDTSIPQ
ncbi:MAG: zinc ribbon domain-containing protein [Candidatus Altimarinota bacterium]